MFNTEIEESILESYKNKFDNIFFPLSLVKKKDYIIINDKRYQGIVYIILNFLLYTLPIFFLITVVSYSLLFGMLLIVFQILFILSLIILLNSFSHQTAFYKNKNYYEIIKSSFFRTNSKQFPIDHLKEVLLETNWYENDESSEKTFHASVQLVFFMAENQIIARGSSSEFRKIANIAYSISELLKVPCIENEINM